MKQIKENEKLTTIVLEDGDIIEVCKMGKKTKKILIKCLHNTLLIDELTYHELKKLNHERNALQSLNDYLKQKTK